MAQGRDFDSNGQLTSQDTVILDEETAKALAEALREAAVSVAAVEAKPYTRKPYEPFRTTTLQQEAGRKLGFTSERTMRIAQELYENGYITYMRTDSVTLAGQAIRAAREQVKELYGERYLPAQPRVYASKVKNAQEAHEAIRPAGDTFRHPDATGLVGDTYRLYELIWRRTVASQMADARGESLQIKLTASLPHTTLGLVASGRTITFPGFLQAYVKVSTTTRLPTTPRRASRCSPRARS